MLAMKVLYHRHVNAMLSLSYRITQNMQDSEEVIQSAFLDSFYKIHQLADPLRYPGWLKRIVVNKSISQLRKQVKYDVIPKADLLPDDMDDSIDYGDISIEKIKDSIMKLPDGCRQVLTLFIFENFRHQEIADMLGIAVSTSKSQYRYALRLLRSDLNNYYHD